MHALVLAFASSSALLVPPPEAPDSVSPPVDDERPLCPRGDGPGLLDTLAEEAPAMSLFVDDGTGELTLSRTFVNAGDGPASAVWDVSLDGARAVIVGASVTWPGRAAGDDEDLAIREASDAAAQFADFTDALSHGVEKDAAVAGERAPGVLVSHTDGGVSVDVAAPCSVRSTTVKLRIAIASLPVDGAWRFDVPRLAESLVVKSSAPLALRVDGVLAHRDVAASIAVPSTDPNDTTPALAVVVANPLDVSSSPLKMRARGFAMRIAPTRAPVVADDGAAARSLAQLVGASHRRTIGYEWLYAPIEEADALNVAEPASDANASAKPDAESNAANAKLAKVFGANNAAVDDANPPVDPVVVARAELDLPKPLSSAPPGLRFVFIVDSSVSVGEAALAKELQLVDEILASSPPDAKFALIAAARKPRVIVAPWSPHGDADGARSALLLSQGAIEIENGSDIPAALKLAQGIASDVDRGLDDGGARGVVEVPRIVVLSDMHLKDAIDDRRLVRAFAHDILTHVVVTSSWLGIEDPLTWQRSFGDEDARAKGPEATGGIWVETSSGEDPTGDDEQALSVHLVRPTRIDRPHITLADVDMLASATAKQIDASPVDNPARVSFADDAGLPLTLVEGSGIRAEAALSPTTTPALERASRTDAKSFAPVLRGSLWSTPVAVSATRDESLLGLFAVDTVAETLPDDIVRTIATKVGAPSRVTSLLALPEWRPARPDDLVADISGCGCGSSCCCCGCRGVGCRGFGYGAPRTPLHEREFLAQRLAEDARACHAKHAKIEVEVNDREILDVRAVDAGTCVVERTWARRLDKLADEAHLAGAFRAHNTFIVDTADAVRDEAAAASPAR